MTGRLVSVIVVSRNRPQALLRCLTGIEQLDYPAFEVIVVADPVGLACVARAGFEGRIKTVPFDLANISTARNLGLAVADGEIVAFIDDDAVPEPTWLTHLSQPFDEPAVDAAGGFVIGRNGISFQHRGRRVDAMGQHRRIEIPDDTPVLLTSSPGDAIKTEGTNCAFRLGALRELGGFDPAYRFYLDETDVNLRLAARRATTAIVPLAQVHHGFAASDRRRATRVPTTLFDIGASLAVFLRKHAPSSVGAGLDDMRLEQRRRLVRFMVDGLCDPRDVGRLMRTLEDGFHAGRKRALLHDSVGAALTAPFLQFKGRRVFSGMVFLTGRPWQAARLRRQAVALAEQGCRVTLLLLGPSSLYHSVTFRPEGVWEQTGGVFGRSLRHGPVFRWTTFESRVRQEVARVQKVRK